MSLPPEEEKKLDEFLAKLDDKPSEDKKAKGSKSLTPLQDGQTLVYIPAKEEKRTYLCKVLEDATPAQLVRWADGVWPGHGIEQGALSSKKSKRQLFDYLLYLHKKLDFTLISKEEIESIKGAKIDDNMNEEK